MTVSAIGNRASKWIDGFQEQLTIPVAFNIANSVSETPNYKRKLPLLSTEDFVRVPHANNLLVLVMGPFGILEDTKYTYWQGFKIVVHGYDVISPLCRLNSNGKGGFYVVKLWDCYNNKYIYYGDPEQERSIKPAYVATIIKEHLAAQYHVGFVERRDRGKR